jgi:hypothetical protein
MTKQQAMKMQAGPACDAAVAEVFGYKDRIEVGWTEGNRRKIESVKHWKIAFRISGRKETVGLSYRRGVLFTRDGTKLWCGSPFDCFLPPAYSTDPALMGTMWEWLCNKFPRITMNKNCIWDSVSFGGFVIQIEGPQEVSIGFCRAILALSSEEAVK